MHKLSRSEPSLHQSGPRMGRRIRRGFLVFLVARVRARSPCLQSLPLEQIDELHGDTQHLEKSEYSLEFLTVGSPRTLLLINNQLP